MPYIPSAISETVTIKRKVRDTRSTFSTVASGVVMSIQPAGGGTRLGDMSFVRQNIYRAILVTKNTSILPGDMVERTENPNVTVLRIDTIDANQQLELEEVAASL